MMEPCRFAVAEGCRGLRGCSVAWAGKGPAGRGVEEWRGWPMFDLLSRVSNVLSIAHAVIGFEHHIFSLCPNQAWADKSRLQFVHH